MEIRKKIVACMQQIYFITWYTYEMGMGDYIRTGDSLYLNNFEPERKKRQHHWAKIKYLHYKKIVLLQYFFPGAFKNHHNKRVCNSTL